MSMKWGEHRFRVLRGRDSARRTGMTAGRPREARQAAGERSRNIERRQFRPQPTMRKIR